MYIFNVCEMIEASEQVKFLSVELYDKYMASYLAGFEPIAKKLLVEERLDHGVEKIGDQKELRALSCIQIATKLCFKSLVKFSLK